MNLDLLDAADILRGEFMATLNVPNGARETSHAGERGCVPSASMERQPAWYENDRIILINYAQMSGEEEKSHMPKVVHVDQNNCVIKLGNDPAEGLTSGLLRPPFTLNNSSL